MATPVEIAGFEKAIKTSYCIDLNTRDRQVMEGCRRVKARLKAVPDHDGHIAVVCYGPSLEETWPQLKSFTHIITCSGAHKFLIDHGIIPTWHCEVDPRPHKADLIGLPHPEVEYLVASVCHKKVFDLLDGYNVKLWHVFSHEAARDNVPIPYPRGEWSITGGSNIGLRSMVLARFMGFKKMTLFGMDYSFRNDGSQHTGWHPNETNTFHAVEADGGTYYTSGPMHHYCQEFFKEVTKIGSIELNVVGEGLLQAKVREQLRKGPLVPLQEKMAMIAATLPQVISTEYAQLNKQLHDENADYGTSGSRRVETVLLLINKIKPQSVLDYGCGKGSLGKGLPIPIWEYDPAIPGKDSPPRPADLVVCTDVLEHVEPDYLEAVLQDLARCTMKVCYCVINTGPAIKTLPDGRNTHLIQKDLEWWKVELNKYSTVAKIEAHGTEIVAVLGPKKIKAVKAVKTAPPLDFSKRITPARHNQVEVKFHTPNNETFWRAKTLFTKEPCTIEWIEGMEAGETMFDVGANIGSYTIWAGAKGVNVVAFEPKPELSSLLTNNIELNSHKSIVHCMSLGDKEQGFPFHALDSLSLPQPDHMKIDVDGNEPAIVRGAAKTIANLKSLLIEVDTNLPVYMQMVDDIVAMGFTYDQAQVDKAIRKKGEFKGFAEYIFRKKFQGVSQLETRLKNKIEQAELIQSPFPHFFIEDPFSDEDYISILAHLPDNYEKIGKKRPVKGYDKRFVATPKDEFWDELNSKLRSGVLRGVLCAKFGIDVSDLKDETLLIRDKPGYKIGPHTDSPQKVVSALFYLPEDESQLEAGTSIYVPLDENFTCPGGPHYSFDKFNKMTTMPFRPNSLFVFLKTNNSFHGVEPYQGSKPRNVLLYDIRRG